MAGKRTKSDRQAGTAPDGEGMATAARPGGLNLWVGAGIGAGIGSAAIAAALLYANRRKAAPPPRGPKDDEA